MPDAMKFFVDAIAGAALFVALLLVFLVDWAFFNRSNAIAPPRNTLENVKVIMDDKQSDRKKLKLAVTPTGIFADGFKKNKWDDMGKLLDELGEGYRYDPITIEDVLDAKKLATYDVVFLTCNGGGEDEMKENLFTYVSNGGILYASDWRYAAVAKAFPEMVVANLQGDGAAQELEADIVDADLRDALNSKKIHLKFDLPEWKTAAFGGPRVKTLMQGTYQKDKNQGQATAPLMVRFGVNRGKGSVIFTSFHNEKQNSRIEKQLLQYLVFSLVTAGIDADVNAKMDQGGFTPQRSSLLSTPQKNQSTPPKTYANAKVSTLRFALGFRSDGAKLRFNIKSPDGKEFTQDASSTMVLEVASAAQGNWTYTVTALDLPYANFPFTVTVGEKQ